MDSIRSSHSLGQTLRNAAIATGLLTDRNCYAEMLSQFYVVTAALEKRMDELIASEDEKKEEAILVKRVRKLGYSFQSGYERDLQVLLGPTWKDTVLSWNTEPAKKYVKRIQSANDSECAAAAFILHDPLVIGGGAALKPEKRFGKDATNVFESVIGASRGGRSGRRREFIDCYDQLLTGIDDPQSALFTAIVAYVREFMDLNNEMMIAVKQSPWWHKYVTAAVVVMLPYLIQRFVM